MNSLRRRRYGTWGIIALFTGAIVFVLTLPEVVQVDMAEVDIGPIERTIAFDGKVRIAKRSFVLVPVTAVYRPAAFEPGDSVTVNDVLGWYRAVQLDERAERELRQRELAIEDVLSSARSQSNVLQIQQRQAMLDEGRAERLFRSGAIPLNEWERAKLRREQAVHDLNVAESRIDQIAHERAALHAGFAKSLSRGLPILSPIRGVVLRKHIDMERLLPAGTGIYDVGTFDSVDVEADVLSTEAELLHQGMKAEIQLGSTEVASALVLRIDPSAFTKLSALGIEEQRVNIILRPRVPLKLGDDYRVRGRIILWNRPNALRVPANALIVDGSDTSVFVVTNGQAQRRSVRLGLRSRDYAELVWGIEKGTTVIVNPPTSLRTDSRVRQAE